MKRWRVILPVSLLFILQLVTGHAVSQDSNSTTVEWLSWSPDGQFIVVRSKGLWLYNIHNESWHILDDHPGVGFVSKFSPDSHLVAFDAGTKIRIINTLNGREISQIPVSWYVKQIEFSPDGQEIAIRSGEISFWNINGIKLLQLNVLSNSLIFTRDWSYFSIEGDTNRDLQIWRLNQAHSAAQLIGSVNFGDQVGWLAFAPDNAHILSLVYPGYLYEVNLNNLSQRIIAIDWFASAFTRYAVNSTRLKLISTTENYKQVVVYHYPENTFSKLPVQSKVFALSKSGNFFAYMDGQMNTNLRTVIIDMNTYKIIGDVSGIAYQNFFSPDELYLATLYQNHIMLWELPSLELHSTLYLPDKTDNECHVC